MQELVDRLRRLPYLSNKNVYRVALYLLNGKDEEVAKLVQAIELARQLIHHCILCGNLVQGSGLCQICLDPVRDQATVCVVESWHDLKSIDASREFKGIFHVLGGSISPLEGIGPEQLNIKSLLERVRSGALKELILATNLTPEGEATCSFICSKLSGIEIKLTRLASGIPMGSTLEFMDKLTISKALEGRTPF
jgi:recombination protein RecR